MNKEMKYNTCLSTDLLKLCGLQVESYLDFLHLTMLLNDKTYFMDMGGEWM